MLRLGKVTTSQFLGDLSYIKQNMQYPYKFYHTEC